MYGKAGCGKTILCSTAIEDMEKHCQAGSNLGLAVFYFSFSDNQKQTYESLARSLVAQLGRKEPGMSIVQKEFEQSVASAVRIDQLERLLTMMISALDRAYVILDALDECPEHDGHREKMLERLEALAQRAPKLRILVTSRELRDIRDSMTALGACNIAISTQHVDADIQRYVSKQVSHDRRLLRLDAKLRATIEREIATRADGMFRWAYCQVQELRKLKSLRPSYVRQALYSLPATLDDTYTRILMGIDEAYRKDALVLLRWLAYAKYPPNLGELAEAVLIDLDTDRVDFNDRGDLESTLNILSELVTVVGHTYYGMPSVPVPPANLGTNSDIDDDSVDQDSTSSTATSGLHWSTEVRLAHFSVKEYLESARIEQSPAKFYHLEVAKDHDFLMQCCLVYLMNFSTSAGKTNRDKDFIPFPLLGYAANTWFYHSGAQSYDGVYREVQLLTSETMRRDWLETYVNLERDPRRLSIAFNRLPGRGSGLYYASILGHQAVVAAMLENGANVNEAGGLYGNALQAASTAGWGAVVDMLIKAGAHIEGLKQSDCALCTATERCHTKIADILVSREFDLNTLCNPWSALYEASLKGHVDVVEILVRKGADVNMLTKDDDTALAAAVRGSHTKVAVMLVKGGADVNRSRSMEERPLYTASRANNEDLVQLIVNAGADEDSLRASLHVASWRGHHNIVELLIKSGVDVRAHKEEFGAALWEAVGGGHERVVQLLVAAGAAVNRVVADGAYALQLASVLGSATMVRTLVKGGADVDVQCSNYGCALYIAASQGDSEITQMLIEAGANLNTRREGSETALQVAQRKGHEEVAQMLIDAGVKTEPAKEVAEIAG